MPAPIQNPRAILAMLTGLNLLNYLDRFIVPAVGPRIQEDLALSDFQFGLVVNAFMVGYFLTSPVFGSLGDRGRRTGLIALGVVVWSVATAATGLAHLLIWMLVARFIVGVGEASYATLAPTIIDDLAPPARKNRWLSVFYVAIPVGAAMGYLLGGVLEKEIGWRNAFYVAGAPGMILGLACLLIREPTRKPATPAARARTTAGTYLALARMPLYRSAVMGYIAYTFALGGFAAWAPTYLYRRFDMPLATANFWFGAIVAGTGLVATFVGGWLGDKWPGVDRERANLRLCAVSCGAAAVLSTIALLSPTAPTFFVGIAATEFALFLSTSPINVVILGAVPIELRASAMAASIFAIHLLGDLISPPLVGGISDASSIAKAMLILPIALLVASLVWLSGSAVRRPA